MLIPRTERGKYEIIRTASIRARPHGLEFPRRSRDRTVQVNTPGDCRFYIESAVDEVPGHYDVIHVFIRTRIGFDSGVKTVAVQGTQYWNDNEGSQQSQADDFNLTQVPGYGDLWEATSTSPAITT